MMDLGSGIMRSGGLGMPWVWDPGMQGSGDHEGMQTICTTYHGCVVGIQTTMDTITIRYIL